MNIQEFTSRYNSKSTRRNYRIILTTFFKLVNSNPETYFTEEGDYEKDIEKFFQYRMKNNYAPKTINSDLGCLKIFFALDRGINNGNGSKIAPLLLVVSGCSFVLVSIFPCDPGCIPISTVGIIHGYMCLIAILALILTPVFMIHRLSRDDKWHNYHIYSLIIVIIALSVVIVGKLSFFMESIGLLQRIAYGLSLLWV